jgi:hypothetical protein
MTLFIACLLIYHYNMEWWWYGVAFGLWWARSAALYASRR